MAFLSGTVEDMAELMTTLRTFLTGDPLTPGRDWTLEELRPTRNASGNNVIYSDGSLRNEWVISNVGENGLENIIVGFREYQITATGNFGCNLNCYTSWQAGYVNFNQNSALHGRSGYSNDSYYQMPLLPLSNSAMSYWFFSNKNRIMIVVKTSSYYQSCYLGFGIRQGSPSEYPYPLVAIGTVNGYNGHIWSTLNSQAQFFATPNLNTVDSNTLCPFIVNPLGQYASSASGWRGLSFLPGAVWSYSSRTFLFTYGADGKIMMFPIYILMDNNVLMSLDGASRVSFSDPEIQSEDVLVHEGKQWIVFNNVYRVTREHYMAINTGVDAPATTTTTTTTTSST